MRTKNTSVHDAEKGGIVTHEIHLANLKETHYCNVDNQSLASCATIFLMVSEIKLQYVNLAEETLWQSNFMM